MRQARTEMCDETRTMTQENATQKPPDATFFSFSFLFSFSLHFPSPAITRAPSSPFLFPLPTDTDTSPMSFFCHSCQKRVSATDYVCDECHQDFIEQVEEEEEDGNEQQQQQQQQQQQPFPAPFSFPPFFQGVSNGPRQQQQMQMPFPFPPFYGVPPPFFPPQPQQFQQMRMQFPFQGMFPAAQNVNVAQMPAGAPMFGPAMMMGAPPVNPMPFQQLFNNFFSVIK